MDEVEFKLATPLDLQSEALSIVPSIKPYFWGKNAAKATALDKRGHSDVFLLFFFNETCCGTH